MSNYSSPRGVSSDSFTSTLPTPPMIFTSKTNGYESDSSEEGRKPPPSLGLRVTNPDEQESMAIEKEEATLVASSSLHTPSESHWKIYQSEIPQVPVDQPLLRRESKTACTAIEACETIPRANFISPTSKYAKISYHLTNNPEGIKTYREMAEKTNDLQTQLSFAKYLLQSANAFSQQYQPPVGSMWGINCTTNKSLRPEPFLIVPPPSSSAYSSTSSKTKSEITVMNHSKRQSSLRSSNDTHDQKKKKLEQEGIDWILKLCKKNVPEACYIQANWIDKELHGFKKNKSRAIALHQIASDAKVPESMFAVADYYEQEKNGMEQSSIIQLYQEATNFGYVNAIYRLALLTIHGNLGLRQSLTEGLKLMYKACTLASPEFNIPPYTFALMLTNEYESVDFPLPILEPYGGKDAAILYYERAASLQHDEAQSKLGSIYEHGLYGESMNFARAFDYYEQAAMHDNAKSMLGLCRLYNRGSHGPEDKEEHNRLENDVSGWLVATPANEDIAFSWCEKSAKAGEPDALLLLGWFYEIGFGVPRDFSRSKGYYELAAEKGNVEAKTRLLNTNRSITKQQHEGISSRRIKKKQEKKQNRCRCM
ncbi:hypothetical protein HPULCUR_001883 [Helicostylum pulchrum]|uniref:Beta-lactamase n=1 Tax=Helicostylum pulchrum TaxID=562976 RepID=A0ABP9XP51_9FUNG